MNRTLKDQLTDYIHQHPELTPMKDENKPRQKPKRRVSERLSRSEIEGLMGIRQATYKRNKGALRQK